MATKTNFLFKCKSWYAKVLLASLLTLWSSLSIYAYDVEIDGIYYNLETSTQTASVTYKTTSYNSYSGVVNIPENIAYNGITYAVTSIGDYAFYKCDELVKASIPNSITTIGAMAFCRCNVTDIIIPYGVKDIPWQTFCDCKGLTKVTIPNSVINIDDSAFSGCSNLTELIFADGLSDLSLHTSSTSTPFSGCPIERLYLGRNITCSSSVSPFSSTVTTFLKTLIIGDSVTSIGNSTFSGCSNLTELKIGKNLTSIGSSAFSGCSSLTELTIPNNITFIGSSAFSGCSGLTELVIPNNITSISNSAFSGCSSLKELVIPSNITSVGSSAFSNCNNLSKLILSESEEVISFDTSSSETPFDGSPIEELYLGRNISYASYSPFRNKKTLTELTIGKNITSIEYADFDGCSYLQKVIIYDLSKWCNINFKANPLFYAHHLYLGDNEITKLTIPNDVTSISSLAFEGCTGLTEVIIPNSVNSIGSNAFSGCTSLISIEIPNSVNSIGSYTFKNCTSLISIEIPNSVNSIGEEAFSGCSNLKEITFSDGNDVLSFSTASNWYTFNACPIEKIYLGRNISYNYDYDYKNKNWYYYSPFRKIESLTSIIFGNSVTSIGSSVLSDCSSLSETTLPNDITSIASDAFMKNITLKVNKGTKTLLATWQAGYTPYDATDGKILMCPVLTKVSSSQRSIAMKIDNYMDEYTYSVGYSEGNNSSMSYNAISAEEKETVVSDLLPQKEYSVSLRIEKGVDKATIDCGIMETNPILHSLNTSASASSIHATGIYLEGEAEVKVQQIAIYEGSEYSYRSELVKKEEGNVITLTGLNPAKQYLVRYTIGVKYLIGTREYTEYYYFDEPIRTSALSLVTSQPKVVSLGNVIVAAETNLDDEETNVGFEWRRIDWGNDFASNTGGAYLYEGTMEGYIRNLNTEQLWKFRPYYLSDSGTYYYGDWVGLDPSNTSYFEPTVHTYATINIEGNTALVKGYALTGTDKVTVQGFKYWKSAAMTRALSTVPTDAMTVEASGQVMTASLTGLDYNSTYHYVAFVTTSEGDTFYGEEQVFATGEDPTGIEEVYEGLSEQEPATVVARYNIRGERISAPQKGLNILRMSDGSTKKVLVK